LLDVAKQAASAGAGHVVGMVVAIVAHSKSGQSSECGWYFVVYFMDCSLGITLAITFHKLTSGLARWLSVRVAVAKEFGEEHAWWEALVDSGHYGDAATPNYRKWAIQVFAWASCVVTARSIVGVTVVSLIAPLSRVTSFMDSKFVGHPDAYLYTVMVCIPLVMNVGQAWIQDQVLKWTHKKHASWDKHEGHDGRRDSDDGEAGHGSGRKAAEASEAGAGIGGHAHAHGHGHVHPTPSYPQLSKPAERLLPLLGGGGSAAAAAGKGE